MFSDEEKLHFNLWSGYGYIDKCNRFPFLIQCLRSSEEKGGSIQLSYYVIDSDSNKKGDYYEVKDTF